MKTRLLTVAFLCLVMASPTFSQSISNDEVDAVVTLFGIQKRQAVRELTYITTKDTVAFWKVYSAFEEDQKQYRKRRILAYDKLVKSYNSMNDKTADELTAEFVSLRVGQEKLLEQYYAKMKAATNAILALQYYQAETYLLTVARATIMQQIPTYGQMQKRAKP